MRIAIYHPWIYLKSGLERTILELKRRSRHQWLVYTSHFAPDATYPELRDMGVVELNRVSVKRTYLSVFGAAARLLDIKLDARQFDALMICCDGLGSLLAFRNHARPVVCLCFTPLRAVYDEEYRKRHLSRNGSLRPLSLAAEGAFRLIDRMAWRRYCHVFCISQTVKQRVVAGGLYPEHRIDIAYPGVYADRIRASARTDPYLFLPGRIMWTKNIELAIQAYRQLKTGVGTRLKLVVAGMVDEKSKPYLERLFALAQADPDISFVLDPSDRELDELYANSFAVLFTAFNEDLGLTPLEGMAHGKPVIALNRGGPTEIVVDGDTGLLVDGDAAACGRAIARLEADPAAAQRMGRNGLERARLFTWETFVEKIDSYFDTLATPDQTPASQR